MIEKANNCKYCGLKMESQTAKKKFCSEKCRVYWNRENSSKTKTINTENGVAVVSIPFGEIIEEKTLPKKEQIDRRELKKQYPISPSELTGMALKIWEIEQEILQSKKTKNGNKPSNYR